MAKQPFDWFRERYDMSNLVGVNRRKTVPLHSYSFAYYSGGIVLFLFALQFITGAGLALYYIPHPEHANKSIVDIMTKVNMGWFFRSFHHWCAQIGIGALFVHTFCSLLLKSYRKPREAVWITGFILLVLSLFFGLSGYFLLWDERAFTAVKVATGGAGNLPIVGPAAKAFLRGGLDVTGDTLTRFYAFHVTLLPLATLGFAVLHLLLVNIHGMSIPLSQEHKKVRSVPFFPNVFYRDLIIWLLVFGIVVTWAALSPPHIGPKADPYAPAPDNIKPEWYFFFLFVTLKLFPGSIAGLNGEVVAVSFIFCALCLFLVIPFIDKRSSAGQKSPLFTCLGLLYFGYFLVMTAIGFFD